MTASRPRVAVYAIARDEEGRVAAWARRAADADVVLLADTGSRDDTMRRARALGVQTQAIDVRPFRFDVARNRALALLGDDVDLCVAVDLDEALADGWRAVADAAWRTGATLIRCHYRWRWSAVEPELRWTVARAHARHGYRWAGAAHERLVALGAERVVAAPLEIEHRHDGGRARPDYLELVRVSARERPGDGLVAHLLANELRMAGHADEARAGFLRALELGPPPDERLHALLALSHLDSPRGERWLLAALVARPDRREPWVELAQRHLDGGDWRACRAAAWAALRISEPADDYLANPWAWGAWPERLAAVASARLGDRQVATHHARRGLELRPGDAELGELLATVRPATVVEPPPDHGPRDRARRGAPRPEDPRPASWRDVPPTGAGG